MELSSNAAAQVRALVEEKHLDGSAGGLRLSVEKGGCAGMQYEMAIGVPEKDDLVVEREGARLYVDSQSVKWLEGCVIDYEDGLSGAGFRVRNPRITRTCGCGTSFEPSSGA